MKQPFSTLLVMLLCSVAYAHIAMKSGLPTYKKHARPMSLTRFYQWMEKAKPESILHGKEVPVLMKQKIR